MDDHKILVVDDEAVIINLCKKTLTREGFDVTTASSGKEGLDKLKNSRVDVLITDIRMPGMDGKELLDEAMKLHPDLLALIITGHGTLNLAMETMKLGAQDFLLKPFTSGELKSALCNLIEKRALLRENLRLKALIPLLETSRMLLEKNELNEVCELIVSESLKSLKGDIAAVILMEEGKVKIAAQGGLPEKIGMDVDKIGCFLNKHRKIVIYADESPENESLCSLFGDNIATLMVKPLSQNNINTLLVIGKTKGAEKFSAGDMEYFNILCNHSSTALERSRLYEKLSKALDDVMASDRVKTAFLNNMCHEFRTPLAVIIGFSEILLENKNREDWIGHDYDEDLKIIRDEGRELHSIFENVMDASLLESGEMKVEKREVYFSKMLTEILKKFEEKGKEKGLLIESDLPGQEIIAEGDEYLLKKLFTYLLDNALKFTHEGKVSVSLSRNNNVVSFRVRDSGVGIDEDKKNIIFEKFRQADDSINRKFNGVGLGLFNCMKMVELMGGNVEVASPPCGNDGAEKSAGGSEFVVKIPMG